MREKTEKGGKFKIIHCRAMEYKKKLKSWKMKKHPPATKNNEITKIKKK